MQGFEDWKKSQQEKESNKRYTSIRTRSKIGRAKEIKDKKKMDSSNQEGEEKKKVSEITTFPVPFPLRENLGSLTINTNSPSKPSKEQIINQAFKFHSQGNISETVKYYQYLINQGFNDHRVFSNYGIILKGLGKLKEAEFSYRKAIQIKPD